MQKNLLPGLVDQAIEFFNHENDLKFIQDGKIKSFMEAPASVLMILKENLDKNPEAKEILMDWFPNSEFNQLKKYTSCKFGGIDYTPDIIDNQIQEGEYWKCPFAGNCKGEGIVCTSPIYNGQKLSKQEIELIRLSTTDLTNEAIASEMKLPLGTFHKLKQLVYEKLGFVQTKQSLTKIAISINII